MSRLTPQRSFFDIIMDAYDKGMTFDPEQYGSDTPALQELALECINKCKRIIEGDEALEEQA